MSDPHYDVYGIGNALVDMEYSVDDGFLRDAGLDKGRMALVDEARIDALAATLDGWEHQRMSGGSAANTVFAVQAFGGRGFYSCRVGDDEQGRHFLDDLRRAGIGVAGNHLGDGKSGRCLTLVTADAERTMTTFLGVSATLAPEDIDEPALAASKHLYVEGYLAAVDSGRAAAVRAREVAEAANVPTNVSLSDPSMVEGCRDGLLEMLGNGVHQLFCNEEEALLWTGADRLDVAVTELSDIAPFINVTLGARGSLAVANGRSELVPGYPSYAVDTTGAGDIYAGAFIHARADDADPATAAKFANFAAADLVSRHGARLRGSADYLALKRRFRH